MVNIWTPVARRDLSRVQLFRWVEHGTYHSCSVAAMQTLTSIAHAKPGLFLSPFEAEWSHLSS